MKTILLTFVISFTLFSSAQNPIPNPGFEAWSSGNPTNWTTNNLISITTPVLQSSVAHAGNSAARLEIVNAFGQAFPPVLSILNPTAISQSYSSFSFYYKCSISNIDALAIDVNLKNNNNSVAVATGTLLFMNNTNVYTQLSIPFTYFGSSPNQFDITFALGSSPSSSTMTIGSYVLIDDLSFGAAVGLNEISSSPELSLGSIYPNPVEGTGLIPFSLSETSSVCIEIYSLGGEKLIEILNTELNAGVYKAEFNSSSLSSGMYLCKLNAEGKQIIHKLAVR
jgi:hypothetical protein